MPEKHQGNVLLFLTKNLFLTLFGTLCQKNIRAMATETKKVHFFPYFHQRPQASGGTAAPLAVGGLLAPSSPCNGGGGGGGGGRFSSIFTRVCVFRGRVFAVKRSPRDAVDITRGLKKELKVNSHGKVYCCVFSPNKHLHTACKETNNLTCVRSKFIQ